MTTPLNHILVPIDFSFPAINAARAAASMCQRHKATLHLVYVLNTENIEHIRAIHASLTARPERTYSEMKAYLGRLAMSLTQSYGIPCEYHIKKGHIVPAVCDTAKSLNANLIALGTNTANNKRVYLTESIPFLLLRDAPCPVLTVPAKRQFNAFKKVLFPVRDVPNNLDKYVFIREILKRNDADMYLFSMLDAESREDIIRYRELLAIIRQTRNNKKVHFSTRSEKGKQAAKVLHAATQLSADLVVITASTERTFLEYLLGSYTQQLVDNPLTPVLSIKPRVPEQPPPYSTQQSISFFSNRQISI